MRPLALLLLVGLAGCVADATVIGPDGRVVGGDDTDGPVDTGRPDDTGDPDPDPDPIDADGDGFTVEEDCDDDDPEVFPGAEERCDLVDHDCDGEPISEESCSCDLVALTDAAVYMACRESVSWEQARDRCEADGMDLVIIDRPPTNGLVQDLASDLGPPVWIGLSDRDREGRFVWVDGTEPTFDAFERGEPNDFGRGEDCVQLYPWNGRWNDASCVQRAPFVCGSGR